MGAQNEQESGVRRNVLLGGRFQTDFVEIRFRDENNNLINDKTALTTLGVILSRKLTEYLGINEQEVSFGIKKYAGYSSIYIFDTAKGGAGYSTRFIDYSEEIMDMAFNALKCDCKKACDKCLIDRTSQWYIENLDRNEALKKLEKEKENREAVPEKIREMVPTAKKVTQDLPSEIVKATSSNEIEKITFFVSKQVKRWEIEGWPFKNLLNRLKAEGKKVAIVLPEPDLQDLDARQITELIEARAKYDIKNVATAPMNKFKPLLQIDYFGKESELFFAEEVNRNFSAAWGESQHPIFKGRINSNLKTTDWKIDIDALQNEDQVIFEFKITQRRSDLFSIFNTITSHKEEKWEKIFSKTSNSNVKITYRDTYLVEPIGCMMINHLIKGFREKCNLKIESLEFDLSGYNKFNDYSNGLINDNFSTQSDRTEFLKDYTERLLNISPKVKERGRLPHWRELILYTPDFELIVRPHGGIKNGWDMDFNETPMDVEDITIDDDLTLFNKSANEGILYNIMLQLK